MVYLCLVRSLHVNWTTTIIGVFALAIGITSTYLRLTAPQKLPKLGAMRRAFGEKTGGAIHAVAYSVIPFILGVALIAFGLRGIALF